MRRIVWTAIGSVLTGAIAVAWAVTLGGGEIAITLGLVSVSLAILSTRES
jgi:hypothetical protein